MDTKFTFPRPQAPIPRPNASNNKEGTGKERQSNALRASVLDAALELGIGSNSLMADWMFSNPVKEEEEEENEDTVSSPGLTYGSSATSEESWPSSSKLHLNPNGPGVHFAPQVTIGGVAKSAPGPVVPAAPTGILNGNEWDGNPNMNVPWAPGAGGGVAFPSSEPVPPRPTTPGGGKKLKKKSKAPAAGGGDGYESDGGYMSEAAGKKKDKEDAKARDKEERKRKKSLLGGEKEKKSKKKTKNPGEGYETDGPAASSSSGVKRFFKLSTKSSGKDLAAAAAAAVAAAAEAVPAVPQLKEVYIPLPIAERFATTNPSLSVSTSGHGHAGNGSMSTVTSASSQNHSQSQNHSFHSPTTPPLVVTRSESPLSLSLASSLSLSPQPPSNPQPLSAASPTSPNPKSPPPVTPLQIKKVGIKPSLERLNLFSSSSSSSSSTKSPNAINAGGLTINYPTPSPSPISPGSPYVVVTPLASPSIGGYPQSQSQPQSQPQNQTQHGLPSSPMPGQHLRSPPVSSQAQFGRLSPSPSGARMRPSISAPNTATGSAFLGVGSPPGTIPGGVSRSVSPSPSFQSNSNAYSNGSNTSRSRPAHLEVSMYPQPSSDYLVPSPTQAQTQTQTQLHSPNVLAYYNYDIPPPSPPPMGPLPSVPLGVNAGSQSQGQLPSAAQLRQRVIDRTPRPFPPDHLVVNGSGGGGGVQRGRASPFPSRPLLPPSFSGSASNSRGPSPIPGSSSSVGLTSQPAQATQPFGNGSLEARVAVRRYRDLYAVGAGSDDGYREEKAQADERRRARLAGGGGGGGGSSSSSSGHGHSSAHGHGHGRSSEEASADSHYTGEGAALGGPLGAAYGYPYGVPDDVGADEVEVEEERGGGMEEEEMRDVLDRFEARSLESAESAGRALGRSRSFEALRVEKEKELERMRRRMPLPVANGRQAQQHLRHPEQPNHLRQTQSDAHSINATVGDRTSRWSGGSVYSNASILDEEESGSRRDRFVKKVEAMLSEGGGQQQQQQGGGGRGIPLGRGAYVPPVPRLPDAYVGMRPVETPGRSWNRF